MDPTEFTQGDNTFYLRPMDPFKALELLGDLQKTFLPAVGAAFNKTEFSSGEKQNLTMAALLKKNIDLGNGLSTLSTAINGTNLTNMLQRILNTEYIAVARSGKSAEKLDKAKLMELYQGNLKGMFELAWAVLRVNYADFFQMLPVIPVTGSATENENR